MAIAKNPLRKAEEDTEKRAADFISKARSVPEEAESTGNRKPIMIRIPPDLLKRIDQNAKRLGLTRSAFIVQSAAEKLESIGG